MDFSLTTVITTINGRLNYFKRALKSIANQKFLPNNLIIVSQDLDDKDKLDVDLLCESFGLKYQHINFPKLIGSQSARYYGLLHTSTKYIHFLDDDDYIYSGMYSMAKELLTSNLDINLLSFNAKYLKKDFINNKNISEISTRRNSRFISKSELIISNKVGPTSGAIISTDILRKIDSFNPKIKLRQDYSNWLLISDEKGLIYTSSELGFYYEINSQSSILKFNPFDNGFLVASVWKIRFKIFKRNFYIFLYAFFYDLKFIIAKLLERLNDYSIFHIILFVSKLLIVLSTYILVSLYLFIKYFYKNLRRFLKNIIFGKNFYNIN